jgi:AcrR family transcriptional regulator
MSTRVSKSKRAPKRVARAPKVAPPKGASEDTRDKEATREALVLAGLEEISARGIDAPSLDAICARAGFTRGAFYVHFKDREDFLVGVMDYVLGRFLALLGASGDGVSSTANAVRLFSAAADSRSAAVHAGGALRFHHLMDACHRSQTIGDRYRSLIAAAGARFVEGVAADQRAGALRSDVEPRRLEGFATAFALGVTAMIELGIPVHAGEMGETLLALLAPHHERASEPKSRSPRTEKKQR